MVSGDESANLTPTAITKRRTRNRVAQRSFRERQARYVKELEQKVAQRPQNESVRLKTAEHKCHRLREALIATKSRVLGLSTALSGIADTIDASLDSLDDAGVVGVSSDQSAYQDSDGQNLPEEGRINSSKDVDDSEAVFHHAENTEPLADENTDPIDDSQNISGHESQDCISGFGRASWINEQHNNNTNVISNNSSVLPSTGLIDPANRTQQSSNHTYPDCIGHETARWPPNVSQSEAAQAHLPLPLFPSGPPRESLEFPLLNMGFPPGVATFPSLFSAHLAVCEYFTKQNQAYRDRLQPQAMESYAKLINTMVNMFVNTCWPDMRIWWAYIQSSTVVEKLVRWKLDPCLETYKSLPMTHRPTALQLCTPHPDIIDWAFFPSIRDRLVELYSHSWMLDEIVCELVNAYVVEADLTRLVTGMENLQPQKGYFSIWDIVQTISHEGLQPAQPNPGLWGNELLHLDEDLFAEPTSPFEMEQAGNDVTWTKMPFGQIYQSRQAALKLFKLLRMEDRRTVKVDPVFAAAHPELCDDVSIVATGIDCTLRGNNIPVPRPKPLTREAIINYKMMLWKANM